ncbi:carbohydrate-binding module family 14 protein [Chitinophaga nivalis]|uniref:Carbohydrate-binding module family 14 protein n=1 Tax=Chitinophaga nivalis TaxID=2991709 RepID=A0ABT3IX48_9BACT|nr:carbohydrate-binding module family 14 protein [Chitinophaga nivalis]MCW3462004.1 carbohydrate-binding module family 14 protein [Chitinophaga nivalis]MCW3488305.1 carbohydrate-binding module family 14 protein [Chitinophaga nivalis]
MKYIKSMLVLFLFAVPAILNAQTMSTTPPITHEPVFLTVTSNAIGSGSLEASSAVKAPAAVTTPMSVFVCAASGRYANPDNCHAYIFCIRMADGTFQRRDYTCAAGMAFDANKKVCVTEATVSNPYPPCNN